MSQQQRIRILLDTCVVRAFVHNAQPLLDVSLIRGNLNSLAITVADTAVLELTSQLQEGRIVFDDWQNAMNQLNQIRDREWPVLPSGTDRAMWSGLCPPDPAQLEEAQRHSVAIWKMFQYADPTTKLDHKVIYEDGDRTSMIQSDPAITAKVKELTRTEWIDFVNKFVQHFKGTKPKLPEIRSLVLAGTREAFKANPQLADRIDLFVKAIARMVHMATNSGNPYNPASEKRRGDMFDLMLLLALGTPLIAVTEDHAFLNGLDEVPSPQRKQVLSIDQFNEHLTNATLSSLLPS